MMNKKFRLNNITILGLLSFVSDRVKIKILGLVIILPLIIVLATVYYGYETIGDEQENYEKTVQYINDSRSMVLTGAVLENYNKAKLQTEYVKAHIVEELVKEYGNNTNLMKADYDSKSASTPFYQILSKNIDHKFINKDNDKNRIFVANKDGVLIDNSLNYANHSFQNWDEIMNRSANYKILQKAINNIHNRNNDDLIIWMDDAEQNKESEAYDPESPAVQFISQCISQGNISELEKYSVVGVSYIFDTKDLFGVPDVSVGHRNDNDKIYIIQVFSIKDMIESNTVLSKSLTKYDTMIAYQKGAVEDSIHLKMLTIILLTVLEVLTFFGIWYLAEFYIYSKFSRRRVERDE